MSRPGADLQPTNVICLEVANIAIPVAAKPLGNSHFTGGTLNVKGPAVISWRAVSIMPAFCQILDLTLCRDERGDFHFHR
jgi:hypothetical protein